MKSFGEIMDDLGFNESASFEAKKSFLKYLFKQANIKQSERVIPEHSNSTEPIQLSLFEQEKSA